MQFSLQKYAKNSRTKNNIAKSKDSSTTYDNNTINSNNLKISRNNDNEKSNYLPLIKSHDNLNGKLSSFEKMHLYTANLNRKKKKKENLNLESVPKSIQSSSNNINYDENDVVFKLFKEFGVTPPLTLQAQIEQIKKINEKNKKKYNGLTSKNKSKTNLSMSPRAVNLLRPVNEKKINFDEYIQLQSKAEMRLRPKFGDESYNLLNYINNIKFIRQELLNGICEDMAKIKFEHSEKDMKDNTNFEPDDKALIKYKWKNIFTLDEYQNFFLDNIKGKISGLNYNQLNRKFKEIKYLSQSQKRRHGTGMKKFDFLDY